MTTERRQVRFETFDEIMPDVDRLLQGHETAGQWSLAQICRHLATVLRRVVDLPASTPSDPSSWVSADEKRRVLEAGRLPEGIPGPPEIMPGETGSAREEADGLRAALAHYRSFPEGPAIPHRIFGPLSKDEWDRLQRIHIAHHLSFAIPR